MPFLGEQQVGADPVGVAVRDGDDQLVGAGWLTEAQHRSAMELFRSDIAPVLRREIPDPTWPWGPAIPEPGAAATGRRRAPS